MAQPLSERNLMAGVMGLSSLSSHCYKLSQTKIDRGYERSYMVMKLWTFPIINQMERSIKIQTDKHTKRSKDTESGSFPRTFASISSLPQTKQISEFLISTSSLSQNQTHLLLSTPLYATVNRPRGFGSSSSKKGKKKKTTKRGDDDSDSGDDDDGEEEPDSGVIPEIVTNRMMGRMGYTVGIPLFFGLVFFPIFYYLKVGLKIDVPTWVPFIVSFIFFGTALLGVSYGIVSSSWDPLREGSLLGWNEAQKNWPVFWQSIWGRPGKK